MQPLAVTRTNPNITANKIRAINLIYGSLHAYPITPCRQETTAYALLGLSAAGGEGLRGFVTMKPGREWVRFFIHESPRIVTNGFVFVTDETRMGTDGRAGAGWPGYGNGFVLSEAVVCEKKHHLSPFVTIFKT
jgi:hypothetical protein